MAENRGTIDSQENMLSEEQQALLDMYIKNLDEYLAALKANEKREVEIETQHLKSVLTKW